MFCIAVILTFVDSIDKNLRDSLSKLGNNVIYVQKWPWLFSSDYPWWKFVNRPEVDYREMQFLQKRFPMADEIGFESWIGAHNIKSKFNTAENVGFRAVSKEYASINNLSFREGRFFSDAESSRGSNSIILGSDLADNLFPQGSAVGQNVKTFGRNMNVTGVMEKEGESILRGLSNDNRAIVPVNFARRLISFSQRSGNSMIVVKGSSEAEMDNLEDELRGAMRSIRRLNPREDDNFALNRITLLTAQLDNIFKVANIVGWVIAAFSILVGGFGVANIMFVSVKERTNIIGIEKALGAPKVFILLQFMGEAILLCIMGGAVGLLLVALATLAANSFFDFVVILSLKNIFIGIFLSSIIGVIAGFIPAYQAANLDPIKAIRYSM